MVAFSGAHVVVTGGTGALGTAVVGALRAAGAVCHVTNLVAVELDHYAHRGDANVHVTSGLDLGDEATVERFYAGLPPLWASIHLAGGFAMAPVAETSAKDFEAQLRMNTLSCFLCSRAAIGAIRKRSAPGPSGANGGRIVNVAARPAIEPRLGAGMVAYAAS
jgi:NAD(P)-dependent dehydrogenase (short-subunit alcohol dehydrogenase family)